MSQDFTADFEGRAALLVLTEDGEFSASWSLGRAEVTIGRLPENDVYIDDRWISRHHARIRREGARYVLEDLGSKNGLFLNGKRLIEPAALEDGDVIQIAPRFRLTFVDNESTAPLFQTLPGVALDANSRRVWVRGIEVDPPLSNHQFVLLQTLVDAPERVFTRDDLIAVVWPEEDPAGVSDEAINSLVRRMRSRLNEIDPTARFVVAVRGHGFRFEQP